MESVTPKPADNVKQVLVIRRDVGMRRGKEIAQGSHAASAFLVERILQAGQGFSGTTIWEILRITPDQRAWLEGTLTTKVVLQAQNEEELLEVKRLCEIAGLETFLIQDAGFTAAGQGRKGLPTNTALGIGPNQADAIDAITGPEGTHPLRLY